MPSIFPPNTFPNTAVAMAMIGGAARDRKSTRLNSSHPSISYAVFCLKNTAPTEFYSLSLHDALPIFSSDMIETVQDFMSNKEALMDGLDNFYVEGGQTAVIDAVYRSA